MSDSSNRGDGANVDDGRGAVSNAGPGDVGTTGLEILRGGIGRDAARPGIERSLNFWIAEVEDGRVVFEGEPGMKSLNTLVIIRGGWMMTSIDPACGCATMTGLEAGISYATPETKVNMARAIQPNSGVYRCESKLLARGGQIITSEATVTGLTISFMHTARPPASSCGREADHGPPSSSGSLSSM